MERSTFMVDRRDFGPAELRSAYYIGLLHIRWRRQLLDQPIGEVRR